MITKHSLGIIWSIQSEDCNNAPCLYQEEVDGLYFFGHWNSQLPESLEVKLFQGFWKNNKNQLRTSSLTTDCFNGFVFDLFIQNWPEDTTWNTSLFESLKWLCDCGAAIAWCGGIDSSPNISVFDSNSHSGNVYAAYSSLTGFLCNASLEDEYKILNDTQLDEIHKNL